MSGASDLSSWYEPARRHVTSGRVQKRLKHNSYFLKTKQNPEFPSLWLRTRTGRYLLENIWMRLLTSFPSLSQEVAPVLTFGIVTPLLSLWLHHPCIHQEKQSLVWSVFDLFLTVLPDLLLSLHVAFGRFIPVSGVHLFSVLHAFLPMIVSWSMFCPRTGGHGDGFRLGVNKQCYYEPSPSFPWHACNGVSLAAQETGVGFVILASSSWWGAVQCLYLFSRSSSHVVLFKYFSDWVLWFLRVGKHAPEDSQSQGRGKETLGRIERVALTYTHYHVWNS